MRQKSVQEALKRWNGMTIYGFTSRPYQTLPSKLSDILLLKVPAKYYLSPTACLGILRRASARGKELPEVLKKALERQARVMAEVVEKDVTPEENPTTDDTV